MPLPALSKLALACRRLRALLGWTQASLAARAQLTQGAISHLEHARVGILSEETIRAVFRALGQDPEALPAELTEEETQPANVAVLMFCGNPVCAVAVPYSLGPDDVVYWPFTVVSAVPLRCPVCGGKLSDRCPECKRPLLGEGALCMWDDCGRVLVRSTGTLHKPGEARTWCDAERARRRETLAAPRVRLSSPAQSGKDHPSWPGSP